MTPPETDKPTPREIVDALVAKFYEPPPMTPSQSPLTSTTQGELLPLGELLTKRERFAMAAMQGLCANPEWEGWTYEQAATDAVMQADWLIFVLNDRPPLKEGMHP